MEENKAHIKEILQHASQQKAPDDLAARVLRSWKEEQAPLSVVPPLISRPVWMIIALSFFTLVGWLLLNYTGGAAQTQVGEFFERIDLSINPELLNFSPIMKMSVAAFALMIGVNILLVNSRRSAAEKYAS